MTRALVTGGTGFAGRFLVRHLAEEGVEVHATSHGDQVSADGAAAVHVVDMRDAPAVEGLLEKVRPEEIYHLAGVTRPASGAAAGFYEVNLGGARNLLEGAASRTPEAKVLLVGSAYAYARRDAPISEDVPLEPRNHYGASKAAAEMLGRAYAALGLRVVLARPFNHSGPGQSPDFVLPSIVQQVTEAKRAGRKHVTLQLGNLESIRDISDVRDVVGGYVVVLREGEAGEPYNLASGAGYSVRELAEIVASVCGIDTTLESDHTKVRRDDLPLLVGATERARRLGWEGRRPLRDTVSDMAAAQHGR